MVSSPTLSQVAVSHLVLLLLLLPERVLDGVVHSVSVGVEVERRHNGYSDPHSRCIHEEQRGHYLVHLDPRQLGLDQHLPAG